MSRLSDTQRSERASFFKGCLAWFWMNESCETISRAIFDSQASRLCSDTSQLRHVLQAFPEMDTAIWSSDTVIARIGSEREGPHAEYKMAGQTTTPLAITQFLAETMPGILEKEFPSQYAAMQEEERRRKTP